MLGTMNRPFAMKLVDDALASPSTAKDVAALIVAEESRRSFVKMAGVIKELARKR